ncbi:hypothetical protein DFH08DRAFT_340837 [Mycena albidolilacea]|uniref:Uncharacterized protein n=1 Tax=Mycena albidolilacea TaxID=1033008 RepID=A0AAD7EHU2_9AGAR|nr:hypothetical protein DFH08DRAFT_340837 [Mycena albidolilacea]
MAAFSSIPPPRASGSSAPSTSARSCRRSARSRCTTDNVIAATVGTLFIVERGDAETLTSAGHTASFLSMRGDESLGLDGDGSVRVRPKRKQKAHPTEAGSMKEGLASPCGQAFSRTGTAQYTFACESALLTWCSSAYHTSTLTAILVARRRGPWISFHSDNIYVQGIHMMWIAI